MRARDCARMLLARICHDLLSLWAFRSLLLQIAELHNRMASMRSSSFDSSTDLSAAVFCSALVAALYQRMGLLPSYPNATSYVPKMFSSEINKDVSGCAHARAD